MTVDIGISSQSNNQYLNIQNSKGKKEKTNLNQTGLGVVAGIGAYKIKDIIEKPWMNSCMDLIKNIDDDIKQKNLFKDFEIAADKVLEKSGLADKGVKLIDTNITSIEECFDIYKNQLRKSKHFLVNFVRKNSKPEEFEKSIEDIGSRLLKETYNVVKKGENSFFHPFFNSILVNKKINASIIPHEIGHAINFHTKGIDKFINHIATSVSIKAAPFVILLTALLKNKKEKGEQTEGIFDKITTFVKNNCGKLTFLSFIPLLYDELLASKKGLNLAKEFLSKNNFKILDRKYGFAWYTYLGKALATSIGVVFASKASDFVKNYFKNENVQKTNQVT